TPEPGPVLNPPSQPPSVQTMPTPATTESASPAVETGEGKLIPAGTPAMQITPAFTPAASGEPAQATPATGAQIANQIQTAAATPIPVDRQVALLSTPQPQRSIGNAPVAIVTDNSPGQSLRRTLLIIFMVFAGLALVSLLLFILRNRPAQPALADVP